MNTPYNRFEEKTNFKMIKNLIGETKLKELRDLENHIKDLEASDIDTFDAIKNLKNKEKQFDVHWVDKQGEGWND